MQNKKGASESDVRDSSKWNRSAQSQIPPKTIPNGTVTFNLLFIFLRIYKT